jgi:hypothetical protein
MNQHAHSARGASRKIAASRWHEKADGGIESINYRRVMLTLILLIVVGTIRLVGTNAATCSRPQQVRFSKRLCRFEKTLEAGGIQRPGS